MPELRQETGRHSLPRLPRMLRRWGRRVRASVAASRQCPKDIILQLSYARSGSSLLDAYLQESEGIGSVGEVLNYGANNGRTPGERLWSARRHLSVMPHLVPEPRVVLKLHLTHAEKHGMTIKDVLDACSPAVVILHYRDDSLAQYMSQMMATHTRAFRKTDARKAGVRDLVHFSVEHYAAYIATMDRLYGQARAALSSRDHFVIRHEDVVQDPCLAIREPLADTLPGIVIPQQAPMARQADRSLAEYLENPRALEGLTIERFLSRRQPALCQCGKVSRWP